MTTVAVDTECTGPDFFHGCRAFMVTACTEDYEVYCWEFGVNPKTREVKYDRKTVRDLRAFLWSADCYVFHNAVFDLTALSRIFPDFPRRVFSRDWDDTMVMAHILASDNFKGLKELSTFYLGVSSIDEDEINEAVKQARRIALQKGWRIAQVGDPHFPGQTGSLIKLDYWLPKAVAEDENYPPDHPWYKICEQYAVKDAIRTMGLWHLFRNGLEVESLQKPYQIEKQLVPVLYDMHVTGVTLKEKRLRRELKDYENQIAKVEAEIKKISGISNVNSSVQIRKYLYEDNKCPVIQQTEKGAPSTNEESLRRLFSMLSGGEIEDDRHRNLVEVLSLLVKHRKMTTARHYLRSYLACASREDGVLKIHTSYNQVGTSTTRLSSSSPNLQNIGKGEDIEEGDRLYNLRCVFGPKTPQKVWYGFDYSQLQLRIFAYCADDYGMIEAFEKGYDFHSYVASVIFKTDNPTDLQRRVAKSINFGLIFGAGPSKIDETAQMKGAYDLFSKSFPAVRRYMDAVSREVSRKGYVITLGGYRLWVPKEKPYVGVCYIVQGTEGEIVKKAMRECWSYLQGRRDWKLILQVHDELVFETSSRGEDRRVLLKIKELMEKPGRELGVKTPVDAKRFVKDFASSEKIEL